MLKEFREYTIKFLQENNIEHEVRKTYTVDGRRMTDEILVSHLPEELKQKGFYTYIEPEENGFWHLCQPTIPYFTGKKYGFIPDDMLKWLNQRT